jgi:hypothetical protein
VLREARQLRQALDAEQFVEKEIKVAPIEEFARHDSSVSLVR